MTPALCSGFSIVLLVMLTAESCIILWSYWILIVLLFSLLATLALFRDFVIVPASSPGCCSRILRVVYGELETIKVVRPRLNKRCCKLRGELCTWLTYQRSVQLKAVDDDDFIYLSDGAKSVKIL